MTAEANGQTEITARDLREVGTADDGNPFGLFFDRFEGNRVIEVPDPRDDELERMLQRDGKARAIEAALTLPLRWATLTVEPQDGDSGEAELVRDAFERPANAGGMVTPVELVVAQMTSAVVHRRAFFEKVFKVDGDRVLYHKLAFRPARTCSPRRDPEDRSFRGFVQKVRDADGTTREETFEPKKAFVYFHGQHRDPLRGASDMETVHSCYEAKQKIRFLWFQFLERNVIPYGVLKTKEDRATRVKEVAKLKNGGVVGIHPDEDLNAFSATGDGNYFKDAMDWLSAEQSGSVLASFTDLAQQGSGKGSFALSKDQTDLFLRSRLAVLTEMGVSLTSWAAADLVRWNFGPGGKAPTCKLRLTDDDIEAARELFKQLAAQAQPNPQVPTELMDELTVKVAQHVGLDVDKVKRAIEARAGQAGDPGEALRQGIGAAAQLVAEAGVGGDGSESAPTVSG